MLYHHVLGTTDQHQVFRVVAAQQHQPAGLVNLVILADAEPRTLAALDTAPKNLDQDQQRQDCHQQYASNQDDVQIGREIRHRSVLHKFWYL